MDFVQLITRKLSTRFDAYDDLVADLDDSLLQAKVEVPRHKSLAEHLWCVVGARESYARAIAAGEWQGFACSMENFAVADFQTKLADAAAAVRTSLEGVEAEEWSEARLELLAALAEHEVMHEGQIIRHMYALEKTLPPSWVWA